jgi:hypothetical protein
MTDTMRSVLTQVARRFLNREMSPEEFAQGLVLAIAESPKGVQRQEDLEWLAVKLTSGG